jgi:DNA-binding NarL/FixJ family response regulator
VFEVREMPHAAPLRILVVDDHVAVRRAVCSLLRSQPDFEVTCEAADGLEAIQKAQEIRPDVIVLDISMPELNGLQAARQIRQVAPESEIVFLSQHRASDIIHEALAIGARGYVCKSHIASDLVDAVRAAGQIRTLPGR